MITKREPLITARASPSTLRALIVAATGWPLATCANGPLFTVNQTRPCVYICRKETFVKIFSSRYGSGSSGATPSGSCWSKPANTAASAACAPINATMSTRSVSPNTLTARA